MTGPTIGASISAGARGWRRLAGPLSLSLSLSVSLSLSLTLTLSLSHSLSFSLSLSCTARGAPRRETAKRYAVANLRPTRACPTPGRARARFVDGLRHAALGLLQHAIVLLLQRSGHCAAGSGAAGEGGRGARSHGGARRPPSCSAWAFAACNSAAIAALGLL